MTYEELDQLPEWPTGFGREERVIDGVKYWVPVLPQQVVFWDSFRVLDTRGEKVGSLTLDVAWVVGWYEGVQYKRRVR